MNELVRYGLGAAAALGVYVAFASHYEKRGAEKVVTRIEKATKDGLKKAESAGRKSADPNAAGVRNPYYRD